MRITIRKEWTVQEVRERTAARYGSVSELAEHVKAHPDDLMAKVALHDIREYEDSPPDHSIRETQEIIIPDEAVNQLTIQRLQLLLALKGMAGRVDSIRSLAKAVNRDIKNVSEDVQILRNLGLLQIEEGGKGKASKIQLPGNAIDLHLVEV